MTEKTCHTCHETKPITEFHVNDRYGVNRDKISRKPDCKVCANAKWKARRVAMLDEIVKEWKCSECGYDRCREALDFHHLDPTQKDFTIAQRWTLPLDKLRDEIAKCVLLCANCHREVHAGVRILGP